MFYYAIDINSIIKSEQIKNIITMNVSETDYNNQLKSQTRMVLDVIFKYAYKEGIEEFNLIQQKQQQNQQDKPNNTPTNQKYSKSAHNLEHGDPEYQQNSVPKLRCAFCILLCMVINNIFEFQSTKITFQPYYLYRTMAQTSKKGFDFWKFYLWILKADPSHIIESIHTVIKFAYGNQRLDSLMKMVESDNAKFIQNNINLFSNQ